ncbi:MAG: putative protein N(5)-glutamine methyltransferase [Frankiales bacterium]|nr:putative protein N(5)-glutamine methyltransferase [Frankiales bacterium]
MVARLRAAGCVFAEEEADLLLEPGPDEAGLEAAVRRREAGEPLEQILGWAGFAGLRLAVEPGVFVPRRRTELLARAAVDALPARRGPVVVDLCCGVGAVAAVVLRARPDCVVHAVDVDPAAVRCAVRNLPGAVVHLGDLTAPLPPGLRGQVDVVTANAPYVPSGELDLMPREARLHEHPVALDGGPDGLDVQRRVAQEAASWLTTGGRLLVETSEHQHDATAALLRDAGFEVSFVRPGVSAGGGPAWEQDGVDTDDEEGDGTVVVIGTRRPDPVPDHARA